MKPRPDLSDASPPSIASAGARTRWLARLRRPKGLIAGVLLVIAVAHNLYQLYPEVAIRVPWLNDNVLHLINLQRTLDALSVGQDPTDNWLGIIALGYPLFHHYQHLPNLLSALVYLPLQGALQPADVLRWTSYLLLSLFPLSIYWSMRRFGLARLPSALAGLLAPLIATNGLYGLEYGSYVWRGYGLLTQLWGMVLLPMALAQCYAVVREGRGYFWAVVLLAATVMSHVVMGYIALGSVVLLVFLGGQRPPAQPSARDRLWDRVKRMAFLLLSVALVTAYFVVPFVQDSAYMNRSVWEKADKYDSYGYATVLGALAKGELFDYGRFPTLTLLAGLGLAVCLWRWRDARCRVLAALPLMWLLLYFGRPTWGALLNLLPMSRDLQLHRLIAGVHLGGIFLMGVGLALPLDWALARRNVWAVLAVAVLTAAALYPVYRERIAYLAQNAQWMAQQRAASQAEDKDLDELVSTLNKLPPGRVYAGLAAKWGQDYKVGYVPMYALLNDARLDMLGYLYHALSLNADVQLLFNDGLQAQYNLFNVRYVLTPVAWTVPDYYKTVQDFGRHRLYQVETTGYFDLVGSELAFWGSKGDFYGAASSWLASGMVQAKQHPTLYFAATPDERQRSFPLSQAGQIISQAPVAPGPDRGNILAETVESNAYQAQVQVQRDSMLMLKATYHPNWHATVDGVEVPTVMLMPSYVGVKVTSGTHQVRFEYQPGLLRGMLQVVGLLTLITLALAEWRQGKPARPIKRFSETGSPDLVERAPQGAMSDARRLPSQLSAGQSAGSPQAPVHVDWRIKLGIYLLFLSIYFMSGAGHFFSTDHVATYLTTQGLVERGSLAIQPINNAIQGPDGQYYAVFGLGQSIANIPFYLAGKFIDRIASPAVKAYFGGAQLGQWGGTVPIFFVSLLNQFITPLTCGLVLMFCVRFGFSLRTGLLTTLMFGLSTAAWVYARDSFQHPLESLLLLLCVYILFAHKGNLRPKHALLAGSSFALGVLTRINVLWVAPAIAVYVFFATTLHTSAAMSGSESAVLETGRQPRTAGQRLRQMWSRGVAGGGFQSLAVFFAPVALMLVCVMYINKVKFGDLVAFNPVASGQGFSPNILLGLYGNLFSVGRSIFLYSPPTLLAVYTFGRFCREHRAEAILFLSMIAIYLVGYSTFTNWHGGWSWGPRYLAPMLPFLIIPSGYFLGSRPRMAIAAAIACLGLGVQLLGLAINYDYVYWDWIRMNLTESAFLFDPSISAIPMHLQALAQGRHIDLWLLEVYKSFGLTVLVLTIAAPLAILVGSLALFKRSLKAEPQPVKRGRIYERLERLSGLVARAALKARARIPFQAAMERIRPHLPYLGGVVLMALLAGLPLFQLKLMSGHDSLAYLPRYVEFYEGLRAGQLFPRWAPDLAAGYGEPTFNFNPPVIYYLTCFFHSLGPSLIASENLASLALLLLAGLGMYLLAGEFFGPRGGLVSATAYVFAPYLLATLYVRHALADFSAFAFIPLAFWGLYSFAQGRGAWSLVIGALSVALLFLSSSSVALIAFPALVLFLGWLAWSGRSWRTFARGIWCLALGMGLSAFFLIPTLAETRFVHIARRAERLDFHDHFVYLFQLIYSPWGYGLSVPGPQDGMSFAIGPVHLLLSGASLLLLLKVRSALQPGGRPVLVFVFLLAFAVFFTVDASRFLWERLAALQPLQFPWRFLSLVSVCTALLCGFPFLLLLPRQDRLAKSLLVIIIMGLFLWGFPNAKPEQFVETTDAQFSPQNIVSGKIAATAREFEPIWVTEFPSAPAQAPLTFVQGQGRILANQLTATTREFAIEITQDARLRLNTFYFPGWTLYVDGAQRPIEYSNPQGVIEFPLEQGLHRVKFVFADTPVRQWSTRLSLLALLLLVLFPTLKQIFAPGNLARRPVPRPTDKQT